MTLKAAEPRFDILDELAPGHPDTEEVHSYLIEARQEAVADSLKGEKKAGISRVPDKRDNSIRTGRTVLPMNSRHTVNPGLTTEPDSEPDPEPHTPKTRRNDPCPWGSGKK